jgi:hypothetical protein
MKDSCVYRTKGFADTRRKWLRKESTVLMKSQHTSFIPISQALLLVHSFIVLSRAGPEPEGIQFAPSRSWDQIFSATKETAPLSITVDL